MCPSADMLLFITGGSGSGKSAYAEDRITASGIACRAYIATMEPFGAEGQARIARHRKMRAGKGFETLECPRDLADLPVPDGCAALLEDLTNLFANEWFGSSQQGAAERVLRGLAHLRDTAALTVVVGNDLFADGMDYDAETLRYLHALADLHREVAAMADGVYEVVCGIPICLRKEAGL